MPLIHGLSPRACRLNAIRLLDEGRPHRQVYKIVLETARRVAKKRRLRWTLAREEAAKKAIVLGFKAHKRRGSRSSS